MLVLTVLVLWGGVAFGAVKDLTHPLDKNTLYWIKDKFELTTLLRQKDPHWIATNRINTAEHGGTHMDAPYHFNPDGWKLGQVPLSRLFMIEGVLINKTEEVLKDPEYEVTMKDIKEWEDKNGPIPKGCVILVMFGWSHKYPDRVPYLGLKGDGDWDRHFPYISGEVAKWMVESGKVYGVGTDTVSPDRGQGDPIVHKTLTKANLFIIENLDMKDLEGVPPRDFKTFVMPMRVQEGTGSPARVIILTKDPEH